MSRIRHAANGLGWARCAGFRVVIGSIALHVGPYRRTNDVEHSACFLRRYEPDQVPRVCGRATLSARRRSPEAVFSWPPSYSRVARRPPRGWSGDRRVVDPADTVADPVELVGQDLGSGDLVVELVPQPRV